MVREALSRLPARQRAALVLREIERLSYSEIAQVIGTNTRGAEATLRRARARFRMEVANSEGIEGERAACQRILRQLANDEATPIEVTKHLRVCSSCRAKASSIKAADKLFGALPPLVAGPALWKGDLISKMRPRNVRPRSVLEVLRGRAEFGLLSPISQLAEIATSLTVAATVSVASVAGLVHRVVVVAPAPPAPSAVDAPPAISDSKSSELEGALSSPTAGAEAASATGAAPDGGQTAATPALPEADSALASATEIRDRVTQLVSEKLTELGVQAGSGATGSGPLPLPDLPSQDDLPTTGILPAGISLPRRRPRPWPS